MTAKTTHEIMELVFNYSDQVRYGRTGDADAKPVMDAIEAVVKDAEKWRAMTHTERNTMKIKIQKLHENAVVPSYAHDGDACFDLTAATVGTNTHIGMPVYQGCPLVCGTGLAFEVPEVHVMLVYSRSGMGFKNDIRLANCVGVIDHGYAGEVMVKLTCDDPSEDAPPYIVRPGDRIAQALIVHVDRVDFEVVEQLALTERGDGGFGSTGVSNA